MNDYDILYPKYGILNLKGEMTMSQMKELFEKVSKDNMLYEKFAAIMKDAETAGKEETEGKLTAFAKEAGYDITIKEMQEFFQELAENSNKDLADAELDMVAGGKSTFWYILSAVTMGFSCAIASGIGFQLNASCDTVIDKLAGV